MWPSDTLKRVPGILSIDLSGNSYQVRWVSFCAPERAGNQPPAQGAALSPERNALGGAQEKAGQCLTGLYKDGLPERVYSKQLLPVQSSRQRMAESSKLQLFVKVRGAAARLPLELGAGAGEGDAVVNAGWICAQHITELERVTCYYRFIPMACNERGLGMVLEPRPSVGKVQAGRTVPL